MNQALDQLSAVKPADRVLLLSHCLRPSQVCPGKMTKQGMACPADCGEACVLGRLRQVALSLGYKGVCIAAGGSMALRFVSGNAPQGIVAVACDKELTEGVQAVQAMSGDGNGGPAIVVVPLLTDGCVDTEVDEVLAVGAIEAGCGNGGAPTAHG